MHLFTKGGVLLARLGLTCIICLVGRSAPRCLPHPHLPISQLLPAPLLSPPGLAPLLSLLACCLAWPALSSLVKSIPGCQTTVTHTTGGTCYSAVNRLPRVVFGSRISLNIFKYIIYSHQAVLAGREVLLLPSSSTCVYAHTQIHTRAHAYTHVHVHIQHTQSYTYTYINTQVQTHVHVHTHRDTYVHAYTYTHAHTYTQKPTGTHTHTHTVIHWMSSGAEPMTAAPRARMRRCQ